MEVKQIYSLVNGALNETLGKTNLLQEDLGNLVDVGTELFNANAVDNFTKKLVDKVGRTIVSDRKYTGSLISVLMDSVEYGSVTEKISFGLPEAQENESWELEDGVHYDQDIFTAPKVRVKYFNGKTTFEVPLSIADEQLKSAFTNAESMNAFLSGLYLSVENSLTVATENLILRTINNFSGVAYSKRATAYKGAINLLGMYKATHTSSTLTPAQALHDKEFIRYASIVIKNTMRKMKSMSTLFNIGGTPKHTPVEYLHLVLHNEFISFAEGYLQSDTFHDEFVELPKSESVAYWQGSGESFDVADSMKINITTNEGDDVELPYIVGVAFDRNALGVANFGRRTPVHRNEKAEFVNMWYKQEARYFNDFNENFVLFYLA